MSGAALDRVRPGAASPRGSFIGTVKENRRLCTDHYRLVLSLPRFRPSVPGQFVQIDCRDPNVPEMGRDLPPRSFEWGAGAGEGGAGALLPRATDADFTAGLAYLRRPFSLADHRVGPDGVSEIDIIHRVIGKGTIFLSRLEPGQRVSAIGPLGNGFAVPETPELVCMVGGGVGIPPMLYLAKLLRNRGVQKAVGFVGAQRHDLLPVTFSNMESSPLGEPLLNVTEFSDCDYPAVVATDDGSRGVRGYVTEALESFLKQRQLQNGIPSKTIIYCCGPTPMMQATARVAARYAIPCQVSLEQPMACGMGTCQSCVIKYRPRDAAAGTDWKYKLTCTDGPVFDTRDILW